MEGSKSNPMTLPLSTSPVHHSPAFPPKNDKDDDQQMKKWMMELNVQLIQQERNDSSPILLNKEKKQLSSSSSSRKMMTSKKEKVDINDIIRNRTSALEHFVLGNKCLKEVSSPSGEGQQSLLRSALTHFTRAINFDRRDIRFFINRCIVYEKLGEVELALGDAETAIHLDRQDVKALYRYGRILVKLGRRLEGDTYYKRCFVKTYDPVVWKEMVDHRLDYLMREESFTTEEIEQSHLLADSLQDAVFYCQRMRKEREEVVVEGEDEGRGKKRKRTLDDNNSSSWRNRKWSPTADFIIHDLDEEVAKINAKLTPKNIFGVKGVVLYECSERRESVIRQVLSRYGTVEAVKVETNFVTVTFDNTTSPAMAISRLHGSPLTGLTQEGKALVVRFSPFPPLKMGTKKSPSSSTKRQQQQQLKMSICEREGECYEWRTHGSSSSPTSGGGCRKGSGCRYRHSDADFLVDFHPFFPFN